MGLKILIVDDSVFMRTIIKNALQGFDIAEISEAGTADEGVAKYSEKKPDIVFMDIVMPGKNGIDALKEIMSKNKDAKVVMCTSVGQEKIIEDAVNSGAYDFITKPFKEDEIKNVISKLQ
ncbi:MAG: response regulator [archaeon]